MPYSKQRAYGSGRIRALLLALFIGIGVSCGGSIESLSGRSTSSVADLRDLPLLEFPASTAHGGLMVVFLSGDGNWARVVRNITAEFHARDVPVVLLESRTYLTERTRKADQIYADLDRIIRGYKTWWGTDSVAVVGFSRGADLAPLMVRRLPANTRGGVKALGLVSPAPTVSLHFRWIDLFMYRRRSTDVEVDTLMSDFHDLFVLCVHGVEDMQSLCPQLDPAHVMIVAAPGTHHITGDYRRIADLIVQGARREVTLTP